MTLDLAQIIISALALIAWTYFMLDRKNLVAQQKLHSAQLTDHETRLTKVESGIKGNGEADKLRMELLNKSVEHIEKGMNEIKADRMRTEDEIRHLSKIITEHIITRTTTKRR